MIALYSRQSIDKRGVNADMSACYYHDFFFLFAGNFLLDNSINEVNYRVPVSNAD